MSSKFIHYEKTNISISFFPYFSFSQGLTDSFLLYYPMNGNAQDLSGNKFHGLPSGVTAVPDRFGVPNSAYYFDGVNDYIDFPLNDTVKLEFPITFAFWGKLKVIDHPRTRFFNSDFVQDNYHGIWMAVNNNAEPTLAFGGGLGGCNPQNRISYKATEVKIDTAVLYHFTGIIRSATNMEMYINCSVAAAIFNSGTGPTNVAYSTYTPGTIGRMDSHTWDPATYLWGYMDEFAYWERALSATVIYFLCDSMPLISPPTSLAEETYFQNKKLLKITDILGKETIPKSSTLLFYIYDNGIVEKMIIIE